MDLVTLGRTLGFSFAAGVNLYATVAILGLAARYGWVDLPPQFQAFNNWFVIGTALVLYLVEFFADKIPYFDTLWDIDAHGDSSAWRRADRGDHSWRGLTRRRRTRGAPRRHGGRRESSHQDQHASGCEYQSGAGLQLGTQPRRRRVRRRPRLSRARAPDRRARSLPACCLC